MQARAVKGYPLSIHQERLWQQGSQGLWRVVVQLQGEGVLFPERLEAAVQQVLQRHTILRTVFEEVPGLQLPVQVVLPEQQAVVWVQQIDLTGLPVAAQQQRITALQQQERQSPPSGTREPLLRLLLLRLQPAHWVLLMSLPSVCGDRMTLQLLLQELSAFERGETAVGEEEPLQYQEVAAWQQELFEQPEAQESRAYWSRLLSSQQQETHLPFALESKAAEGRADTLAVASSWLQGQQMVSQSLLQRLHTCSQQLSVSVESFVLTCWQVLLWRLSQQQVPLLGVACDGRQYQELHDALGPYTRLLPVPCALELGQTLAQGLAGVQEALSYAQEEQDFFQWEPGSWAPEGAPRLPAFSLSYGYERWPEQWSLQRARLRWQGCWGLSEASQLHLQVSEVGNQLHLCLCAQASQLSASQVQRLLDGLLCLLDAGTREPNTPIEHFALLSAQQERALLSAYQGAEHDLSREPLLLERFEQQVQHTPQQLALCSGQESLSYQQLNEHANQLAHRLRRLGVQREVVVALGLPRGIDMIVALLAVLKAGGIYAPLDVEAPSQRLLWQWQDLGQPLLLCHRELLQRWQREGQVWQGNDVCLDEERASLQQEPSDNLPLSSQEQDGAYVMYTSGSTGVPKGVLVTQGNIRHYSWAICQQLAAQPGWGWASVSSLAADLGNTCLFGAFFSGGWLQVVPQEAVTSGRQLAQLMSSQPVQVLKLVPSHLSALLVSAGEQAGEFLPRRHLVLGGEGLPWSLLQRLLELGANCEVTNHYGPTETTVGVLVQPLGVVSALEPSRLEQPGVVPLGRPLSNVQAVVLDGARRVVPVGVSGELYITGAGVSQGYWQQPEATRARFVSLPHLQTTQAEAAEAGWHWYRTGDLVRYGEEGWIHFVGRADRQVKLRGYRIEPEEIEAVLSQHANVWDCVVQLRQDLPSGPALVAYIVPHRQPAPTTKEIQGYLQGRLPRYMLPSFFILLETLPLTPNGKVDFLKLPLPDTGGSEQGEEIAQSPNPIEAALIEIWEEVLKTTHISIHDNFFTLGGHSLLATQVISRIHTTLQVDLPILSLFEMPTIAGLAQQVEQARRQQQGRLLPPLQAASRAQPVPASFAQQRLWFLQQLNPGQATYNIPLALRLEGQLNPAALQQSLQRLIDRHESLRTTLQLQGEQVVQCIAAHLPLRMPLIDLRELPAGPREEQARQLAQAEEQLPFDLAKGPLLRVTLLLLQSQEYVLLLNRHHCISDGWSNSVFQRELSQLYHAQLQGEMAMLPELPIQYADYALWQRSWLQGEVLEQQLAYWRQKLKRVATLNFPTDYPRPAVPSFRGANHSFALPQQLTQALKGLSRQQDVTLFMTLLAAFQTLLHQYTGQEDIVVGTDIANRTCVETEGLIGLFVNLLVLRTDFHGNPSFHEVLTRVRETVLGAYMHQDIPFEILVDALQPDHPLDRMPLVQVLFVMQNTPKSYGQLPGLTVNSFGKEVTSSKFDMALFVSEDDQGMRGNIIYSTDLFEEHSIVRLSQNFVLLLQEVVDMPENAVNATKTHRNVGITEQYEDTEQYENYLRKMKFSKRAANN